MNVCHITTVHKNRYDDRIYEKECISLAEAGYNVTLLVNDDLDDEISNGVQIRSLRCKPINRIDRMLRISNMAYKKAIDIDASVYHIHDPELLRIAVKLQRKGKKVIFDSHEFTAMQILTKEYIPLFLRNILSIIYRKYEINRLNKLSGVIMPCLYEGKDYFENVYVHKAIIDNYPVVNKYKDVYVDVEKREEAVCYIGGITEERGAVEMIKAASLAGKRLVIIGDINKELHDKLKKMPEYKNVDYKGTLPHEIAVKEAAKCAVGLALLHDVGQYAKIYNLPVKVYEYMMMGIPAIVSDFPYYKMVLSRYNFGKAVNPLCVDEIADAINEVLADKNKQKIMSKSGMEAINNDMNWNNASNELIGFYSHIK